jgi:DNA-binding transcriptional MerR regulator
MTIGEVAERTGLTTQAIRYYEREGLLPLTYRTHTGYRVYGPEAVTRLAFIKQARRLGLSLREVKQILQMSDSGKAPCCQVRALLAGKLEELERTIAELLRFRDGLRQFLSKIATVPDPEDTSAEVCQLIQMASSIECIASVTGQHGSRSRLPTTDGKVGHKRGE